MKSDEHFPKSIKKAIRYIRQDASLEQLKQIQKLLNSSISSRTMTLAQKKEIGRRHVK
ncbi:hypothetical protein [Metabacillus indicus]|uniref:hypothetical protein n=1 Tax=Metabacillus indicus TaxID=246786 RepID=UPI000AC44C54|nr:hypothetical protein [Metabacillus indicus]